MFHIKLNSGLGNRLFQYASIKGFAKKLNMDVNILEIINTFHEYNNSYAWFNNKIANDIKPINISDIEYDCNYDQPFEEHIGCTTDLSIFKNKTQIKMQGYFQYEDNFIHIREELLDTFKESPTVKELLDTYEKTLSNTYDNITVLHIRLGDYINCGKHFVNLENYYMKCIKLLRKKYGTLNVLIVCEDPQHIQYIYNSLIYFIIAHDELQIKQQNNAHSVEFDLYLLTRCKNVICSNSTFAWWGAWLNQKPEKEVFIPNKWLNDRPNIIDMNNATIMEV